MVYTGGMMSEIDEVAREASLQYADQMIPVTTFSR